jgi:ADP-ribose pyrophosphatase
MVRPRVVATGQFIRMFAHEGWEYVKRLRCRGAVLVVAVTDDQRLLLVEQRRVPLARNVIELPAGLVGDVDAREGMAAAAKRELLEETGYSARRMTLLASGPTSGGVSADLVWFMRAEGLRRRGPAEGDGTERLTLHEVPLRRVDAWLRARRRRGVLVDPKIYAGLYLIEATKSK